MSSRTTPILLGAMTLIAAIWLADQFKVFSFIDNWGKGNSAELAKLDRNIATLDDLILKGVDARDQLAVYEHLCLPYDPDEARSKYQAWLSTLVSENNLRQSSVEVGMPNAVTVDDGGKKREAYQRYGFTVNAAGTLEQVTAFLFDFYDAGHLHKINTMSLNRSGGGRFNLNIGGEALGLKTCERKSELSEAKGSRLAHATADEYAGIVRRNIFSREVGAILKQIVLSSVTYDRQGVPEAWFRVGAKQATKKLNRGGKFRVSVHEIEALDIQPRSVLVDVDGDVFDIRIGRSLFEAMSATEVATK